MGGRLLSRWKFPVAVLDGVVLHDVEALSSTQRHLDEEAVSRMDDEGGTPDAAVNPLAGSRTAGPGSWTFYRNDHCTLGSES